MSSPPNSRSVRATASSTLARSVTSQCTASACRPVSSVIRRADSWAPASLTSASTTDAPS